MAQVKLRPTGAYEGPTEFELEHAQNILDFQKSNPPCVWILDDSNYVFIDGKITPIEVKEVAELQDEE